MEGGASMRKLDFKSQRTSYEQKCQDYTEEGKPIHRPELLKDTVFTIISTYQAEYRGLVEYYRTGTRPHP